MRHVTKIYSTKDTSFTAVHDISLRKEDEENLAIVKGIIEALEWHIDIKNTNPHGIIIVIDTNPYT